MKPPKVVVLVVVCAALEGRVALRGRRAARVEAPASEPVEAAPPPAAPPPPPPPAAAPPPSPSPSTGAASSEAALMARLRELGGSNPELSLRLAREGNRQFKDSAEEPERRWFIVRSLMDLARPEEARDEARVLIDKYPTSERAEDVRRHLFVNPPTHPLERGYGKKLELE